ncbi:hypothetical protein J2S53_002901 [Actinopolyspora lacussalsi]|nr:hypothetical protein [Actinopolyspora lacussalsi]
MAAHDQIPADPRWSMEISSFTTAANTPSTSSGDRRKARKSTPAIYIIPSFLVRC